MSDNLFEKSLKLHEKLKGKIEICSKVQVSSRKDLSVVYSPGVAEPCKKIKSGDDARKYVASKNTVAVISDGSAVLGLGNIGAEASLPVMEGKALLFKEFAGIDAFPIVLDTQDTEEIIKTIKNIATTFGGINLEDISAPRCFEIEQRLQKELDIPVFHDDQHGTAIVVLAGLYNALELVNKNLKQVKIIINGAGAAGVAIVNLLHKAGAKNIYLVDSGGIISNCRADLNKVHKELLKNCVLNEVCGELNDIIDDTDVFIGVSVGNILNKDHIKRMKNNPIVFALANPIPEIMPNDAKEVGAFVVATGRSDFPNQVNNALVFPGIFKGALRCGVPKITDDIKLNVAKRLARYVKNPNVDNIIPDIFDKNVVDVVADAVCEQ